MLSPYIYNFVAKINKLFDNKKIFANFLSHQDTSMSNDQKPLRKNLAENLEISDILCKFAHEIIKERNDYVYDNFRVRPKQCPCSPQVRAVRRGLLLV